MEYVEIIIRGEIDEDWSDWLGNLAVRHTDNGNTLLSGNIRDQSALHGLLSILPNLGLQLLNVSSKRTPADC
jgi:hypothetical protein